MAHDINDIRAALKSARAGLLKKQNVVATGVGYKYVNGQKTDSLCISCSVVEKKAADALRQQDVIPKNIDGIDTDVIQTGVIRALKTHTDRHRPAPGGVSIGHKDITAGTLGCLVKKNGQIMILSNNHVMANSNSAAKGDAILQPGPHDGGTLTNDLIAHLEEFVPISFSSPDTGGGSSGCSLARAAASLINIFPAATGSNARLKAITTQAADNLVDAAIARPVSDNIVTDTILDIGILGGTVQGELGMAIQKSGRTTEHTTGTIDQIDVTVNVGYGPNQTARFVDQFMAGAMSQGGDSGSAVVNNQKLLTGLLFAGSDSTTIINPIEHVFSALGISL